MIEINLVPLSLRVKKKGQMFGKVNIPLEVIVGCGGGLLFLLVVIHVVLLFVNIGKLAQHKALQNQWEAIKPDKENVDSVVNEMRAVQGKYKGIEAIIAKGGLSWAKKLNVLSDGLARGVWLRKVSFENNTFIIEGSAISKDASEIISIHQLASALKDDASFMEHFASLELGSIQRRKINAVEVADFVITVKADE